MKKHERIKEIIENCKKNMITLKKHERINEIIENCKKARSNRYSNFKRPKGYIIIVKQWFDRKNSNTYYKVKVLHKDGAFIGESGVECNRWDWDASTKKAFAIATGKEVGSSTMHEYKDFIEDNENVFAVSNVSKKEDLNC